MKIDIKVNLNKLQIVEKIDNDEFWKFAATQWHRLITPFTPMRTGILFESVIITPGVIEYTEPYAHHVYDRKTKNDKKINFRKDKHPLASAEWDKAAMPTQKDELILCCQKYADKIHFN